MGMREGQEHPLHAQHLGPGRSEPGETDIGPAVGCANDLDFPPADSPGRLASLERLVDRFLGGEPYGHVGRGVWPALAVGALGRVSRRSKTRDPLSPMMAATRDT